MSKNNRIHVLNSIAERSPDAPPASLPADSSLATYGEDVFGEKEMRAFLPKSAAAKLLATVNEGKPRDPSIAAGKDVPRDASAAAIFASGLYELASYVSQVDANRYLAIADKILDSLESSYQADAQTHQGFLLLHSTGNHPANDEIDVPINYADYYYLEALTRQKARSQLKK